MMELVDRIGGFGKVMLTAPEQRMLEELSEIVSPFVICSILERKNPQIERYEAVMQDLFPMFPLEKGAGLEPFLMRDGYYLQSVGPSSCLYKELPAARELRMRSRMVTGTEKKNVDLRVLIPPQAQQEGYFMSFVIGGDHYLPECIDDIVKILGEREKLPLKGLQMIKNQSPLDPNYGIAEVPQLRTVLKLYERADGLLRHVGDTIKITFEELRTLRDDMLKHPNIALRRMSAVEYQKALEALTDQ